MSGSPYNDALIEKARAARAAARLEGPTASVTVDNPLCGDRVTLDLILDDGRVTAVGHRVRGCVLCQAAAVVLAENAVGRRPGELRPVGGHVAAYLRGEAEAGDAPEGWADLALFAPVRAAKSRRVCVTLPFAALARALDAAEAGGT